MFMNNTNIGNKQLSDWALIPSSNGELGNFCLKGAIYNDNRFQKGSYIASSNLQDVKMVGNDIFFITGKGSVYQCNVHEISPVNFQQTLRNIDAFAYSTSQKLLNQAQLADQSKRRDFISQASSLANNIDKLKSAVSNLAYSYSQSDRSYE